MTTPARSARGAKAASAAAVAPQPTSTPAPRDDGQAKFGLRVRMYRVGFGDFFLLSVPHGEGHEHILIDCGVHHSDIRSIESAVAQMAKDCEGKLALVVMTHRHADHISGFAKCAEIFKTISVDAVWMPWFEDPNEKEAVRAQAGLTALAAKLKNDLQNPAFSADAEKDPVSYNFMAANITGDDGTDGGSNQKALRLLHSGFKDKQTVVTYYRAGDDAKLPESLIAAGLTAEILGPPGDVKLLTQMRKASEEYLTDIDDEDEEEPDAALSPFNRIFHVDASAYDSDAFKYLSVEDIRKSFLGFQFSALAASAINADKFMNNQSLVVVFRFNGKSLLFVGDAQWGNWRNFLYGPDGGAEIRPEARDILNSIHFYKVGHHGSANATPKDAVPLMRPGCICMCSTQTPAYDEVPRGPLLDALRGRKDNHLARSDQVKAGAEPPNADAGPLDKLFDTPNGELFIDYNF
jgi:beta-lactamase superfamily II metal-dependent hydrolase